MGPMTPAIHVDPDFEQEFPGASASATTASANLLHTASLLLDQINRHRAAVTRLSPSACQALAVLDGAEQPLSSTEIANRLLVTTASMTSLLDTLERRELVRRVPHPHDRRKVLVEITAEGRATIGRVMPMVHAANASALSPLTEQERAQLTNLLGRLQDHLTEIGGAELPTPEPRRRPVRR
jgi:DNA-binding MarR family transcriptional regulator